MSFEKDIEKAVAAAIRPLEHQIAALRSSIEGLGVPSSTMSLGRAAKREQVGKAVLLEALRAKELPADFIPAPGGRGRWAIEPEALKAWGRQRRARLNMPPRISK